jgi:uncharacterized protein YgbK (DUF1537 family)
MRSGALTFSMVIVADDLTGALDAAAPFASRGLRTVVGARPEAAAAALSRGGDVISLNTASRELAPQSARERVEQVLALLPAGQRLFKKVDSRLKGNVEAELSAFPARRFAVLPAIPEFGRIVEGGHIHGFGVDLPISIATALGTLAVRADVPDTRTVAELRVALDAAPPEALLVGARGLADALAERLAQRPPQAQGRLGRALTMVIGSRDPITLAQIDALRHLYPAMSILKAPNGTLPPREQDEPAPPLTLLQATPGDGDAAAGPVAAALSRSLRNCCLAGRDGLLISGGATAEIVLQALELDLLEVTGEIVAGLPVSKAGDLTIITKSGGFGSPDALVEVAAAYLIQ